MFQRVTDMNLRGVSRPGISVRDARAVHDHDVDDCAPVRDKFYYTPRGRAMRKEAARAMAKAWENHERRARERKADARPGIVTRSQSGFQECAERTAQVLERRGTEKAKRLSRLLQAGALEVRGGANKKYSPVKEG